MSIEVVRVPFHDRAYEVRIGADLIAQAGHEIRPLLNRARVAIITDEHVAKAHLPALEASLKRESIAPVSKILPAGEATKSWEYLSETVEWLLSQQIERGDVIVALGGGVIGDLVGFCSAILRRGVRFVQVPTSLLAQVDSSVGGKTGINSPHGKNLVGVFHQPTLVLADTVALNTLPQRQFLSGYGEVMKYALLGDRDFFDWLETNGDAMIAGDVQARIAATVRCVQMKSDIVLRDETEQGDRALLNLGHTFCHALESVTGYSERLLHGEGVAIGCALAFELSVMLGVCAQDDLERVRKHIRDRGMKSELGDIPGSLPPPERLLDVMRQDKKVIDGRLTFILARGIGEAFIDKNVPEERVLALLSHALERAARD